MEQRTVSNLAAELRQAEAEYRRRQTEIVGSFAECAQEIKVTVPSGLFKGCDLSLRVAASRSSYSVEAEKSDLTISYHFALTDRYAC